MRILNRQQFLQCPQGTVFFDYVPATSMSPISVKTDDAGYMEDDFCRVDVDVGVGVAEADATESCCDSEQMSDLLGRAQKGERISLHFDGSGRDGGFDPNALFAVLDDDDVERLIALLVNRKVKT